MIHRMSESLHIKICGITRPEDAVTAASYGASSLGLVFSMSERRIGIDKAIAISQSIPKGIGLIGVFVDAPIADILSISDRIGLNGIQLSGSEDSDFARALKDERPRLFVIKTIVLENMRSDTEIEDFAADLVILDAPRVVSGPKRQPLDIKLALRRRPRRPFFIAGGLNPRNIAHYIEVLRPAGVDVSSGIEINPGIKNEASLRSLMSAAKGEKV